MRRGWIISVGMHAFMLVLVLFPGLTGQRDREVIDRVTDVSILDAATFARLGSAPQVAPEVFDTPFDPLNVPQFDPDAGPPPSADDAPVQSDPEIVAPPSARDPAADLSALTEQVPAPVVGAEPDVMADAAPPPASLPDMPAAVSGLDRTSQPPRADPMQTPPSPRDAPRISGTASPPPPSPVPPADTEVAATEPADSPAPENVPEQDAAAPEESTESPAVAEESGRDDSRDYLSSTAPQSRPRDFAAAAAAAAAREQARLAEEARVAEARAQAEAAEAAARAQAQEDAVQAEAQRREAEAIEEAVRAAAANAEPAAPAGPSPNIGPPLTPGEKEGLRLAVQRCWIIPAGLENAANLRVVLAVELDPDGRILGQPRLIEPARADRPEIRTAFEAARRALLRCQGAGYQLPREKYEQWRNLEVGFDPQGMLARW